MRRQNPEQLAAEFNRDGFVIARGMFSENELTEIKEHLDRFVAEVTPTLPPGEAYFEDDQPDVLKSAFRLNEHDPFFKGLLYSKRIRDVVSKIFNDASLWSADVRFFAKAERSGSRTIIHQDNGFQFMEPPEGLTATIALDASSEKNGVLCCLRETHALGLMPHKQSGIPGFSRTLAHPIDTKKHPEVNLCMEPGDVSFHHINTVHYSNANKSSRSRRQIGIPLYSSLAKRNEAAFRKYQENLAALHKTLEKA